MKNFYLVMALLLAFTAQAQVGIGTTTPDASSILELESTTQGMLTPRMTETQRDAIAAPATGLLIYQTDNTPGFYYFNGAIWTPFGGSDTDWTVSGNDMYNANTGNVGVGNTAPTAKFHITGTSSGGSGGSTVNLLNENFDTYTVIENNSSTGCTVDGWETTTSNATVDCTNCAGTWIYIDSDETGCNQNSTAIVNFTSNPTVTTINISFDYRYRDFSTDDSFRAFLYNNTLGSQVGADLVNTVTNADTTYSGTATVISGNSYSLRFEYIGNFDYGASVDNILVTETSGGTSGTSVFRLEDGTQQNGYVLTSDANGNATWQAASGGGAAQTLSIAGNDLTISGGNTVTLPNSDDQTIDVFSFNTSTNILSLSLEDDGQATQTVDLSGLAGGGGSYTFENGIYESAGDVRLGGTLNENTTIDLGSYSMTFNVNGFGDFVLQANGVDRFTYDNGGNLRIDSDGRTDQIYLRSADDYVNFGGFGLVDGSDGSTLTDSGGSTYTKDFAAGVYTGGSGGSGFQMGSIEYFVDGTAELFCNYDISPESNGGADLGTASYRWGTIYATNGTINTSDITLKTNINPLSYGLKEIMEINPISYNWRQQKRGKTNIPQSKDDLKLGFSAQELLKIIPEVVQTHSWVAADEKGNYKKIKNNKLGVYYSDIIPITVKAIQEQQAQIEELRTMVLALKKENEELKNK